MYVTFHTPKMEIINPEFKAWEDGSGLGGRCPKSRHKNSDYECSTEPFFSPKCPAFSPLNLSGIKLGFFSRNKPTCN